MAVLNRRALCFVSLAAALLATPVVSLAQAVGEYQVKAAYLSKFVPFVEWPPAAMPAGAPLKVCLAGPDPFGQAIALVGETVADHKIQIVHLAKVDGQAGCHVLYVRSSRAQSAAEALAAVRGKPVLTVTDAADGGATRGIVHFVLASNRVRFEIDPAAAQASGLMLSSKLQSLALPRGGR